MTDNDINEQREESSSNLAEESSKASSYDAESQSVAESEKEYGADTESEVGDSLIVSSDDDPITAWRHDRCRIKSSDKELSGGADDELKALEITPETESDSASNGKHYNALIITSLVKQKHDFFVKFIDRSCAKNHC